MCWCNEPDEKELEEIVKEVEGEDEPEGETDAPIPAPDVFTRVPKRERVPVE